MHTDRGSQYASHEYRKLLNAHGLVGSMSRKGDCWDIENIIYTTGGNDLTRAGIDERLSLY